MKAGGPLFISMMQGLGDGCYQRPFVRAQAELRPVYVDSCWPEMYADLPGVHLVRPRPRFRTQAKHIARLGDFPWAIAPQSCERAQFTYTLTEPGTICDELERRVGLAGRPFVFDLPDLGPPPIEPPYAVIRPVSVRREWRNTARNPNPSYVFEAARMLREGGYRLVCVADLSPRQEELVGMMPEGDVFQTAGELDLRSLLSLVRYASVVVGGVGWIVPVAAAYGTPAVIISGGQGRHNAPEILIDPRMDGSQIRFILPDAYCRCRYPRHQCRKEISGFASKFTEAVDQVARRELQEVA